MKRPVLLGLSALLLALTSPVVAAAQPWPGVDGPAAVAKTGAEDIALIVAIENYAFLPSVPGARHNAADWEKFLSEGLGVEQVLLLSDKQAVREEILAFAKKAATAASADSTVWVLFVGMERRLRTGKTVS